MTSKDMDRGISLERAVCHHRQEHSEVAESEKLKTRVKCGTCNFFPRGRLLSVKDNY